MNMTHKIDAHIADVNASNHQTDEERADLLAMYEEKLADSKAKIGTEIENIWAEWNGPSKILYTRKDHAIIAAEFEPIIAKMKASA